jgi:putative membrane protein
MWKPSWREIGNEPDYRFSLANERTFLAWVRTALAILAGAVLLDQLASRNYGAVRFVLVLSLIVASAILTVLAYFRWRDNEIAMRRAGPLPAPSAIPVLTALVALVCVLVLLFAAGGH